jgi:hypothetical protein
MLPAARQWHGRADEHPGNRNTESLETGAEDLAGILAKALAEGAEIAVRVGSREMLGRERAEAKPGLDHSARQSPVLAYLRGDGGVSTEREVTLHFSKMNCPFASLAREDEVSVASSGFAQAIRSRPAGIKSRSQKPAELLKRVQRQHVDVLGFGGGNDRGDELRIGANIGIDEAEPVAAGRPCADPTSVRLADPALGEGVGGDQFKRTTIVDLPAG